MKKILFSLSLILPAAAMPPAVGTTSSDVTFAQASGFSGGQFQTLTDTRLSNQPGKVQVLVYLTPW